jgi:phytoene dehydrogenase-like protein
MELKGGWTAARRGELGELTLASLEPFVPTIRSIARVTGVLTPADIASRFDLEGGHEMHGEISLDQLGPMRPSLTLSRHTTPIGGLYLGSSGTHPGGAISGRPGWLAAGVLGRS